MIDILFKTNNDWAGFVLRLTAGCIMLPHGLQKIAGWFGGYGFNATMNYFTSNMKLPWVIALVVIITESVGSLCLIAGFFSRVWAALFVVIMAGAIATTNWQNGFFMNWFGTQQGEGYEYHLLLIGICVGLLLTGSGKLSIDGLLR